MSEVRSTMKIGEIKKFLLMKLRGEIPENELRRRGAIIGAGLNRLGGEVLIRNFVILLK